MGFSNKKIGNSFEQSFAMTCKYKGWFALKIPDGVKNLGNQKIFRVPCPFDFVLAKDGKSAFVDVKTTDSKTFPKSKINEKQLGNLLALHSQEMISGYIVFFRQCQRIVFFNAKQLATLTVGESLRPEDGIKLGTLGSFDLGLLE